jgi:hypothetical protein
MSSTTVGMIRTQPLLHRIRISDRNRMAATCRSFDPFGVHNGAVEQLAAIAPLLGSPSPLTTYGQVRSDLLPLSIDEHALPRKQHP